MAWRHKKKVRGSIERDRKGCTFWKMLCFAWHHWTINVYGNQVFGYWEHWMLDVGIQVNHTIGCAKKYFVVHNSLKVKTYPHKKLKNFGFFKLQIPKNNNWQKLKRRFNGLKGKCRIVFTCVEKYLKALYNRAIITY